MGMAGIAALAAPYLTGGGTAAASPPRSAVWAQVEDASPDEARLLQEIEDSLKRKKGLDAKVSELDVQLKDAQSDLHDAENQLYAVTVHEQGTEKKLDDVRQLLAAAQEGLRAQAIAAYVGRPTGNSVIDLLRSTTIDQIATKRSYIDVLSTSQAELIATRERLEDRNKDLIDQLKAARTSVKQQRDSIAAQQSKIQADRDAQAAVRYQASVEVANHDSALQEIVARKDEFQAQAKELEAQSAAIAESLGRRAQSESSSSGSSASSGSTGSTGSSGGGRGFSDPLPSIEVTSPFGYRVHPIYGSVILHAGVDLAADTGDPIKAAGEGDVVTAGWLGGYGNAVIIDHGGGLATLYGHQSQILVGVGDHVKRGQVIGRVGCTGSCTGPHLHFEVRVNGNPVDPMPYL